MTRAPLLFISHGAPSIALEEDDFTRAVHDFGQTLDGTPAMVVVSAHWQSRGLRVNAAARPEPIYDFGGFAPELYTLRYDAPGEPALAREIAGLTGAALEEERGWDHGLWVPLRHLRPQGDIPIVELSLPVGADLMSIGRALAPLRDRGIVITGSGGIVHNLRMIHLDDKFAPVDPWAREFDAFIADALEHRDFEAIANYRTRAPHASLAVPTPEHFEPLLVLLGASSEGDRVSTIFAGFQYGNLSMRTFALRE
jgi:4,5-DOPA dioxygenase extradiol